ncbi:MAG: peptidoglycan-binding protein [Sphaerospermopsis sp. SIO1G2]|nr:peptidoglycan-binding protein [Sphaerospermopsis sp. SIO1G2]
MIAATPEPKLTPQSVLTPGMKGLDIKVLQMQLKALGFYQGEIDGDYGKDTQRSVAQFQTKKGLQRTDGIADTKTQSLLNQIISGNSNLKVFPTPTSTPIQNINNPVGSQIQQEKRQTNFMWWSLLGLGILTTIGGFVFILNRFKQVKQSSQLVKAQLLSPSPETKKKTLLKSAEINLQQIPTDLVKLETKSFVTQPSICEELMEQLCSDNYKKRRQAIWKLAQEGDSRAVKPLVDLMVDTDSEQHSLILSTLAEIGTCTLNPINRALIISMRDENPQVRKNALRDLVRVYDTMGKMSKIVLHAIEDPDPEVQQTAKYALNQMNRIRTIPDQQMLTDMGRKEG